MPKVDIKTSSESIQVPKENKSTGINERSLLGMEEMKTLKLKENRTEIPV